MTRIAVCGASAVRASFRSRLSLTTTVVLVSLSSACEHNFSFDTKKRDTDDPRKGSDAATAPTRAQCATEQDCPIASLHCDVQSGLCFECIIDADCASKQNTRCDALHRCIECLVDEDCAPDFTCDRVSRRCLERCLDLNDCASGAHACDERRNVCVSCDRDQECRSSAAPYCAAGGSSCVACKSDEHCASNERCDLNSGQCVGCRDSLDCTPPAYCDPDAHTCVGG